VPPTRSFSTSATFSPSCAARRAQARPLPLDIPLFEAAARLGGKIHTERDGEQDGGEFVIEAGPDSFLASKPQGLQLCAELGLGERLIGTNEAQRRTYIYSKGRLHDLPEGFSGLAPGRVAPLMRSGLLSPLGKVRLLMDYVLPPRPAGADESVAAFMRRRLGVEAFDRIYLNVHWESDVIGALLLGSIALLSATVWLDRPVRTDN